MDVALDERLSRFGSLLETIANGSTGSVLEPSHPLRQLPEKDQYGAASLLHRTRAREVKATFGEDILAWAYAYAPTRLPTRDVLSRLDDVPEVRDDLRDAMELSGQLNLRRRGKDLFAVYAMSARYASLDPGAVLETLFSYARKPETFAKHEDRYSLALTPLVNAHGWDSEWRIDPDDTGDQVEVWWDGHLTALLSYDAFPVACLGMRLRSPTTIEVCQLQGLRPLVVEREQYRYTVKHKSAGGALSRFAWRDGLLAMGERIAGSLGFPRIAVRSGVNNPWTEQRGSDPPKLDPARASEVYDATAERNGYVKGAGADWYKDL